MPGWCARAAAARCAAVTCVCRFDIKTFDKNFDSEATFDSEGFAQSKALVDDIIAREVAAGIPHNRIILGGFSQGGAVALFAGLQAEHALGGLLVLSSWMPARWRFPAQLSPAAKGTPIWQGHGTMDPLIPLPLAQMSHEFLKGLGLSATLSTYKMEHSSHPKEMEDIVAWLHQRVPEKVVPTTLPSEAELRSMGNGELKRLATSRGISTSGFLEKEDFIRALIESAKL